MYFQLLVSILISYKRCFKVENVCFIKFETTAVDLESFMIFEPKLAASVEFGPFANEYNMS